MIWYNDIEDGFNISKYYEFGKIGEYWCNQSNLDISVIDLFDFINFDDDIAPQGSGPYNIFTFE